MTLQQKAHKMDLPGTPYWAPCQDMLACVATGRLGVKDTIIGICRYSYL